jgi:hypothetical protein
MAKNDDLPSWMTGPVARPRDDEEENYPIDELAPAAADSITSDDLTACHREDYGRFRTAFSSGTFYLLDISEGQYASFGYNSMEKLADVVDNLREQDLDEAIDNAYSSTSQPAADRLHRFSDRREFSDEDVENLNRIKEDWLDDMRSNVQERVIEEYEQFQQEGLSNERIISNLQGTYGWKRSKIRDKIR